MAGSGKTVAGCRLVAPPVVKPVAGKPPNKCRFSGLFLSLTTKATEKQKENQSEQKTESRVLSAEFFNVRCQPPLSGSHLPGSPHYHTRTETLRVSLWREMHMAKQADYPAQNRKENKKVQFIVSREFAGSQTMREAFEQLIERQTCERFEEWQKRQAS